MLLIASLALGSILNLSSGTPLSIDSIPSPVRLTAFALDADLDMAGRRLKGSARLEVENVSNATAAIVPLLLGRLMRFDRMEDDGGQTLLAEDDVVVFADSPMLQVRRAIVHLARPVPPGGRTAIRVRWSGPVVGYPETGSLYIRDRIDPEFTILRADAYAFPVVGVPSRMANKQAAIGDFSFDARVTVPKGLTVANGGELVGREEGAEDRVVWRYRSEAAPFLNIAVAPYETTEEGGIRVFAFPRHHEGAARVRGAAARAVALFRSWFGPTARPPRFAIIEIPEGWGSQANLAGGIIQTESAFTDPGAMIELYHEISHFWNVPDTEPLSPRWNEGLASYLQYRAAVELDGKQDLDATIEAAAGRLRKEVEQEPRLSSIPMAAYGRSGMTDDSYGVGRLLFAILEKTIGAARFREVLGGFYQRYKLSGATTADLASYLEDQGGGPVRALLEEWLTTARWALRLRAGETPAAFAARYRKAG